MSTNLSLHQPMVLKLSDQCFLHLTRIDNGLNLELRFNSKTWSAGEMRFPDPVQEIGAVEDRMGVRINVSTAHSRFHARLTPITDPLAVQIVERARGPVTKWEWTFVGSKIISHRQLAAVEWERPTLRLGAFTQYGQLFDYKDWAFAQSGEECNGIVGLAYGKWSHPNEAFIMATRTNDGMTLDMRWRDAATITAKSVRKFRSIRRSYLLVHATSEQVLTPKVTGVEYFEHPTGHAAWEAALVSRLGVNRPERLAALRAMNGRVAWKRPTKFIYGDAADLEIGFQRVVENPELAPDEPLWRKDFATARRRMFDLFERFDAALRESAFLSPLGNAVAIRPLAPMAVQFHILDLLGQIDEQQREKVIDHLAALAEMIARRDFYPHHYAMKPPEFPYGEQSYYRGMLNQNFHTDGYVLVGLAGCVLPDHPRAKHWRQYAVRQFESQMAAYVWPGGAWEESHTYANHVKITLLPFILAMRHAPEKLDLMKNENFRKTCRFFADLITPKDAVIAHLRGVPPVGDHGYLHGNHYTVFGWLATATDSAGDPDHDLYRWAYQETGFPQHNTKNSSRIFDPLLLPDSRQHAPTPSLPAVQDLTGYGASCRSGTIGSDNESLLVVRAGLSWGHYHPDQGSFWWWAHGRMLIGDANLGDGELKFQHRGHSLLSYPKHSAQQYLDRPNYHVDQMNALPDGGVFVRCQLPIVAWGANSTLSEQKIPPAEQPHNVRIYEYDGRDRLVIRDQPVRSPNRRVLWCLHVVSTHAEQTGKRVVFDLTDSTAKLLVTLDDDAGIELKQFGATLGLFCEYAERPLQHTIEYVAQ